MKVGILTFHEANNYGAILQAYSMQKILESMYCESEFINYYQPYIVLNYRSFYVDTSSVKKAAESLVYSVLHYNIVSSKNRKFDKFRNDFMNISKKKFYYGDYFDNKG